MRIRVYIKVMPVSLYGCAFVSLPTREPFLPTSDGKEHLTIPPIMHCYTPLQTTVDSALMDGQLINTRDGELIGELINHNIIIIIIIGFTCIDNVHVTMARPTDDCGTAGRSDTYSK